MKSTEVSPAQPRPTLGQLANCGRLFIGTNILCFPFFIAKGGYIGGLAFSIIAGWFTLIAVRFIVETRRHLIRRDRAAAALRRNTVLTPLGDCYSTTFGQSHDDDDASCPESSRRVDVATDPNATNEPVRPYANYITLVSNVIPHPAVRAVAVGLVGFGQFMSGVGYINFQAVNLVIVSGGGLTVTAATFLSSLMSCLVSIVADRPELLNPISVCALSCMFIAAAFTLTQVTFAAVTLTAGSPAAAASVNTAVVGPLAPVSGVLDMAQLMCMIILNVTASLPCLDVLSGMEVQYTAHRQRERRGLSGERNKVATVRSELEQVDNDVDIDALFLSIVRSGFCSALTTLLFVGYMLYLSFGSLTAPVVSQSIDPASAVKLIVGCILGFGTTFVTVVNTFPLLTALDSKVSRLFIEDGAIYACAISASMREFSALHYRDFVRCGYYVAVAILASALPWFDVIAAYAGSIAQSSISCMIPAALPIVVLVLSKDAAHAAPESCVSSATSAVRPTIDERHEANADEAATASAEPRVIDVATPSLAAYSDGGGRSVTLVKATLLFVLGLTMLILGTISATVTLMQRMNLRP